MFLKRLNGKCQIKQFMRIFAVLAILTTVNLIPSNSNTAIAKSTPETASISEDKTETVESLIKKLRDKSFKFHKDTVEALVKIGEPAIEPLIKVLGDNDYYVRWFATQALGQIGEPAVEPLIKKLGEEGKYIREAAAWALGNIGDTKAAEPLIKLLADKDKDVREAAARALGKIGDVRAVEPLIKALGDKVNYVREDAAEALGNIGDIRAVEPLIKALGDKDRECNVSYAAAKALVKIGEPAVEPLIKALGDWSVRWDAARTLAEIGDTKAVEPLVKLLEDENKYLRETVFRALDKLGWKPVSQKNKIKLNIINQKWDELVKAGKPAVEPLIKVLGDRDNSVRFFAARALGNIGDTKAVEPLIKTLQDQSLVVRKAAALALEKLNYKPRIHEKYIIPFIKIHPVWSIILTISSLTILGVGAILLIRKKLGK